MLLFFFFNDTATTEIYTLSLHDALPILARAGFDVVSTANNHAWDGGPAAVEETMRRLTRVGVRFVGSGFGRDMAEQPVILERRGWRGGVFSPPPPPEPAPPPVPYPPRPPEQPPGG